MTGRAYGPGVAADLAQGWRRSRGPVGTGLKSEIAAGGALSFAWRAESIQLQALQFARRSAPKTIRVPDGIGPETDLFDHAFEGGLFADRNRTDAIAHRHRLLFGSRGPDLLAGDHAQTFR
jgi:hypothetical protein